MHSVLPMAVKILIIALRWICKANILFDVGMSVFLYSSVGINVESIFRAKPISVTAGPISIARIESPTLLHSSIVRFLLRFNRRIWLFTGYERTDPHPNGDGRAQCAVGNEYQIPFDVTVYADDGFVYKVGPNEVSIPSPDYAKKGFFNNTFYPIVNGRGPVVGPNNDHCKTGPAPNVNKYITNWHSRMFQRLRRR